MSILSQMPQNCPNARAYNSRPATMAQLRLSLEDNQSQAYCNLTLPKINASARQLSSEGLIENWLSQCKTSSECLEESTQYVEDDTISPPVKSIRFDERSSSVPSLLALFATQEEYKVNLLQKKTHTSVKNARTAVNQFKARQATNAGDATFLSDSQKQKNCRLSGSDKRKASIPEDSNISSSTNDCTSMTSSDWGDEACELDKQESRRVQQMFNSIDQLLYECDLSSPCGRIKQEVMSNPRPSLPSPSNNPWRSTAYETCSKPQQSRLRKAGLSSSPNKSLQKPPNQMVGSTMLLENPGLSNVLHLVSECKEWASNFPHLRLQGNQLPLSSTPSMSRDVLMSIGRQENAGISAPFASSALDVISNVDLSIQGQQLSSRIAGQFLNAPIQTGNCSHRSRPRGCARLVTSRSAMPSLKVGPQQPSLSRLDWSNPNQFPPQLTTGASRSKTPTGTTASQSSSRYPTLDSRVLPRSVLEPKKSLSPLRPKTTPGQLMASRSPVAVNKGSNALLRKFVDESQDRPFQRAIHVTTTQDMKSVLVDALVNVIIKDFASFVASLLTTGEHFKNNEKTVILPKHRQVINSKRLTNLLHMDLRDNSLRMFRQSTSFKQNNLGNITELHSIRAQDNETVPKQFLLSGTAYKPPRPDPKLSTWPAKPCRLVVAPSARLIPLPKTPVYHCDNDSHPPSSSTSILARGRRNVQHQQHQRASSIDRHPVTLLPPIVQQVVKSHTVFRPHAVNGGNKRNTLPSLPVPVVTSMGHSELDPMVYSYSSKLSVRVPMETSVQYSSRFVGSMGAQKLPTHHAVSVQRNPNSNPSSNKIPASSPLKPSKFHHSLGVTLRQTASDAS